MENTRAQKSLNFYDIMGVIKKSTREIDRRGDAECAGYL